MHHARRPGLHLDLVGPGLTLFTGPAGAAWHTAAASLPTAVPLNVHGVDALTARGLGIGPAGAVLTRPDAAPAGWWPGDHAAAAALGSALRALLGGDGLSTASADTTQTRAAA